MATTTSASEAHVEDPSVTVMDELARTSGVAGVERLAALFARREPAATATMSARELRAMRAELRRFAAADCADALSLLWLVEQAASVGGGGGLCTSARLSARVHQQLADRSAVASGVLPEWLPVHFR